MTTYHSNINYAAGKSGTTGGYPAPSASAALRERVVTS